MDDEGGNNYSDYIASISTSIFGLDLGLNYTTIDGYTDSLEADEVSFSISKSF